MAPITQLPEQLQLLDVAKVPVQFRLDEATRRRGLAHIAAIRAQLEEARQRRQPPTGRHPGPIDARRAA